MPCYALRQAYIKEFHSQAERRIIEMSKINVMDHPLILHKISLLRDENTDGKEFRSLVKEIALLMGYEATRDLPVAERQIKTPITMTAGKMIEKQVVIVPILRAGLGMVEAMMDLIPASKVGHVGLYRDHETLEPVEYYCKLPPNIEERQIIVLDPMLATGGSASAAIGFIKKRGAKKIKLMSIIAAPEGVERISKDHPEVEMYLGAVDEKLNEVGYIVPGLGDAGDRLFGTL